MSRKDKTLCEWNKQAYRKEFAKLAGLVKKPEYVCVKCGRAAKEKCVLCSPQRLE